MDFTTCELMTLEEALEEAETANQMPMKQDLYRTLREKVRAMIEERYGKGDF